MAYNGLANYNLQAGPRLIFVNYILLGHGHTSLFLYCLWFLLCYKGRPEQMQHRLHGPQKKKKVPKVFTIWGLDGKSANSWPRTKTGIDSISESTPSVQQVGLTCRRRLCVDQIQLCNINLLGAAVDIFVLAANYLPN